LAGAPGHSARIVLTLALGNGATTTIYGVVHGVLLQPLPFPDQDRLRNLPGARAAGAISMPPYLENLIVGVSAVDPLTLVSAAAMVLLSALSVSFIPARRAAQIDPMVVLKEE